MGGRHVDPGSVFAMTPEQWLAVGLTGLLVFALGLLFGVYFGSRR